MVTTKVLNIYKLNTYQILNFMFQIKTNTAPCIFENQLTEIQHQYSSRFRRSSFVITRTKALEQTIRPKQKPLDGETSFKNQ